MRPELYQYIQAKPILKNFIREQPIWYRKLSRNPNHLKTFENSSLQYYKMTLPDRIEQLTNSLQMASMMFHLLQSTNDK
jgi:YlbE-like protein